MPEAFSSKRLENPSAHQASKIPKRLPPLLLTCLATCASAALEIESPSAPGDFPPAFTEGQSITFAATGSGGDQLDWVSDIDGLIGTGDSFSISSLSPGSHEVTATPAGGGLPSAEVLLTVIDPSPITPTSKIELFDGDSLNGLYAWMKSTAYTIPDNVFNFSPGVLNVRALEDGYLATHNSYRDYVMVFEFRWGDETYLDRELKARDSGLILHSLGTDGSWNDRYLPGLEVQVMEGGMGDIILLEEDDPISVMIPVENVGCGPNTVWNCRGGDRYKADGTMRTLDQDLDAVHWKLWDKNWMDSKGFRGVNDLDAAYDVNGDPTDEWNRMVVVSNGSQITVYFNGQLVSECFNVSPTEGKIQTQLERAEYDIGRWDILPLSALNGPALPLSLPSGILDQAYSETIDTHDGVAPYTWALTAGSLPTGLTLDGTNGIISGTPTASGAPFTIAATDAIGNTAFRQLSISFGTDNALEDWRQFYFGVTTSTDNAANDFDGDLDGWVNLIEFALNGIPGELNDRQKYQWQRLPVPPHEHLALTFPTRDCAVFAGSAPAVAEVDGVRYSVFGSEDLDFGATLSDVLEVTPAESTGLPTLDAGWEYRTFRLNDSIENEDRGFLRLGLEAVSP